MHLAAKLIRHAATALFATIVIAISPNICLVVMLFSAIFLPASSTRASASSELERAPSFAVGGIGAAGTMSASERNLRTILSEADAVQVLEALFPKATPAGQLYCLLGLRQRDPAAYDRLRSRAEQMNATIETVRGCMIGHEAVRDLVREIDRGGFDPMFNRRWPDQQRQ